MLSVPYFLFIGFELYCISLFSGGRFFEGEWPFIESRLIKSFQILEEESEDCVFRS